MNDQILMCGVYRRADAAKQREALADRELVPFAILVDRQAVDVFHDQVRDAIVSGAAVQQPGDVAVVESRQDLTFGLETVVIGARDESGPYQLHGHLLLVFVVALGQIDVAHPAAAQAA